MKHRPTKDGVCPRCDRPTGGREVFTEDGSVRATALDSALLPAVPVGLLLTGVAGSVFLRLLGGNGAGLDTRAAVIGGLLLISISWVWAMGLAFRESRGWFFFALFVPFISVMAMGRWKPFILQLLGAAMVVFGVVIAPAGVLGAQGRAQEIARLCTSRPGAGATDCSCVGRKAAALLTPEDQKASFDPDAPALRELMVTAEVLCRKDVLVARCVAGNRGDTPLCTCVMESAVVAFTAPELEEIEASLAGGSVPPIKYAELRADCLVRLGR